MNGKKTWRYQVVRGFLSGQPKPEIKRQKTQTKLNKLKNEHNLVLNDMVKIKESWLDNFQAILNE